jgi:hypothetical protein
MRCGIVFEKYRNLPPRRKISPSKPDGKSVEGKGGVRDLILHVAPGTNPFTWAGRMIVFLILLIWGWIFILTPMKVNYPGSSFWHLVNLPFHEAGHILFTPFGRWMSSLGGTLGQLLIPLLCLTVLLVKTKDPFGGAVSLWWLGESFMDIAPYIADARKQELMLLGGVTGKEADYGYHDWEFILGQIGCLRYDQILAHLADKLGVILMLISFLWAGAILLKQVQNMEWGLKDE